MVTIKSYTDIEQSKKLAKILPIESADMVLPFRHTKNDEYIPGYVASRNYVEVYNEMMKLPGMGKEDVCQLIQPAWSLAALLNLMICPNLEEYIKGKWDLTTFTDESLKTPIEVQDCKDPVDACYKTIIKLHELNLL